MLNYYVDNKEVSRLEFIELLKVALKVDKGFLNSFDYTNKEDYETIDNVIENNVLDYVDYLEYECFDNSQIVGNNEFLAK